MKKADKWVNLEGEPPAWISDLLEAGRDVPDLTPEQSREMESSFLKALAVQRQERAKEEQAAAAKARPAPAMVASGMAPPPMPPPDAPPDASAQPGTLPAADPPDAAPSSDPSKRS